MTATLYEAKSTAMPTTKVAAGGLAAAITVIIVWGYNSQYGVAAGAEVPGEIAAAITAVLSFALAYFVPEKKRG